jgi:hypothetical protein
MTAAGAAVMAARIFSAAVDHCLAHLPGLPLILVDDCSPDPLMQQYLGEWDRRAGIQVIRMGAPVASGYYQRTDLVAGSATSFGHAPCLDRGLWYVWRHLRRPWALVLDGDVLLLADDCDTQVAQAVDDLDGRTLVVGEWVGTPADWAAPQWADARWHGRASGPTEKADEPVPAAIRAYGYVNMMCSVVDLEQCWHPRAQAFQNTGWVANQWFYSQMARGQRSAYRPFFRSEAAVHIGGVAVATTQGESFGNIQGGRRYGQRETGNYYAGYLQVAGLAEFSAALRYREQRLLDRALFVPPPPPESVPAVEPHLRYGSAFESLDAECLRLTLDWVEAGTLLARATLDLEGPICRIQAVEGATAAVERACYEEAFEHTPALMRTQVWTQQSIAERLGTEREVHETRDGWQVFSWRYFSRGTPQWRWAEHFGWGRTPIGPLETQTR